MLRIVVSEPARLDLREHFGYLAESDYDKALDFFDAARQTFADLARMPVMGSAYPSSQERLKGLRKWHIKGFKRYLVFYRHQPDSIEIVRVLYGAQDIRALLDRDT
ncbi:type II toxin-antitoxin system RelE/ParE family toxin [Nodosilinea sp. LEGE 07088]|uniref:type II toxin-antitoxin system RelE/ParE family toxin n=1 Tax=Nodosilinea sp. LEGE 07088 TaxID=2777968 RepID=UPI00187DF217|nr:type II toxin-antitoxin system RelE/ParE family toxin [Nodosilinea sp. LEGE 07088]MBE9136283.1 type II toxin-antitoxin system RelE/ParE family toxin [Nodosilinea sp. LEGE 07088]